MKPKDIIILLIICVGVGLAFFLMYYLIIYNKLNPADIETHYTVSNLVGLLISVGTIYFVFKTYNSQKEQIEIQRELIKAQEVELEANRRDIEYDRALDLIYEQLQYTNKSFEEFVKVGKSPNEKKYYELFIGITTILARSPIPELKYAVDIDYLKTASKVLAYISKEFRIYDLIIKNDKLNKRKQEFLSRLVTDNVDNKLFEGISDFQYIYRNFKNDCSIEFSDVKNRNSLLINNIEHDLTVVLGYMAIEKDENLDLGE